MTIYSQQASSATWALLNISHLSHLQKSGAPPKPSQIRPRPTQPSRAEPSLLDIHRKEPDDEPNSKRAKNNL